DVLLLGDLVDIPNVCVGNGRLCNSTTGLRRQLDDVVRHDEGAESGRPVPGVSVTQRTICSHQLNSVTGFGTVDQVVVKDHIDAARKLACWCSLGHFL